jgi:hypothetical protein
MRLFSISATQAAVDDFLDLSNLGDESCIFLPKRPDLITS